MSERQISFYIPRHGREKVTLRIPESHTLHVCPPACGRRNGIRAIRNGEKGHISFLHVTPKDLSVGSYEDLIGDAVEELLDLLSPKPRVFELRFHCVEDFLGTDEGALLEGLSRRFPHCRFVALHHDPVSFEDKVSPGMREQERMFSLLRPMEKDDGVNFMGNFVPLLPGNELMGILSGWGAAPVRQIFACEDFDQYERMAASRLNLVFQEMGIYAASRLKERLGTDWLHLPVSYRLAQIREQYGALAQALGKPVPDLDDFEERLAREALKTRKALRGREIIVDSGASMRPCSLARALLELGLNVCAVMLIHYKDSDAEDRQWLMEHCPHVALIHQESYEQLMGRGLPEHPICVGYDSAYLLKAEHFVDMYHDEGLFGYYGLSAVLRGLRRCVASA